MNLEIPFPDDPDIARIVEAWTLAEAPVGEEALMRFVLGWSPDAEADAVRDRMVRSAEFRKRALALRQELREGPIVDRDFRSFLGRELPAAVRVVRTWLRGPRAFQTALSEEGRILRGALTGAAGRMMRPANPYTTVRGGDPLGDGLEVFVTATGELQATASVPHLENVKLLLEYRDPVLGAISLGQSMVEGGRWTLTVEGFGSTFGLAAQAISAERLRLVRLNEETDGSLPAPWNIAVQVHPSEDAGVSVPFAGDPYFEREEGKTSLVIPLKLEPALAEALAKFDLCAYLAADPLPIPLGRRSVVEVAREGRLRVAWFAPEEPVPAEVLLLRLKPTSGF